MISKEQIEKWMGLYEESDNQNDIGAILMMQSLKNKLVEAKVLVDRWGTVITDWVFHSSHKAKLEEQLKPEITPFKREAVPDDALAVIAKVSDRFGLEAASNCFARLKADMADIIATSPTSLIWGARVHYSDDIPVSTALGIALHYGQPAENDSGNRNNSIVVFLMPPEYLSVQVKSSP